jgi:hypothetical protein
LRRTHFALPLVLVVGCGSSPKSTTPPTGSDPPTATETEHPLPPPPGSGAVTKSTTENGITLLTYASGDKVYVRKDGTCFAEYSSNCGDGAGDGDGPPEITTCNPPPPQQVKCPVDAK